MLLAAKHDPNSSRGICSVDQGIYGHLIRPNLAMLAAERGNGAGAARLWRAVLAECPGDREALDKLRELNPERSANESRSRCPCRDRHPSMRCGRPLTDRQDPAFRPDR